MSQFNFRATRNPKELFDIYEATGREFGSPLTAKQFAEIEIESFHRYSKEGHGIHGFYLEDKETGKIVASATVKRVKGFYKVADRSQAISSVPDPSLFGVENVTLLLLGNVVTAKEYRAKGLGQELVKKVIGYTEEEIVREHLEKSDVNKKDSFKNMVETDGMVDTQLANYYLGKKYFWVLYSGAGRYYERFGFKAYPLDFYKVPPSILTPQQEGMLESLVAAAGTPAQHETGGKKLRFLYGSKQQDLDLIKFIFQGKELEILTELNKLIFHSDLVGSRKSSSSLTDIPTTLHASRLGSFNALSSIYEANNPPPTNASGSRKASIHHMAIPKIAFKPDYLNFQLYSDLEAALSQYAKVDAEGVATFNDIKGAILTNELQQKSHYILWHTLSQNRLVIVGMGELKFDMFSAFADPTGVSGGQGRRRGSSFTGMNDLGGYNFHDLDVLLSAACYANKKRHLSDSSVYIATGDLVTHIPDAVLHDYFMNYLPKVFDTVYLQEDASQAISHRVEYINDAETKLGLLPMMKLFGKTSPQFDLDWNFCTMASFD